ncbi:hypothetical protein EON63_16955 [archaeon]|nr:MAG: hypothetical protein EON63_16955 [archaeon]
MYVCMCVCVCVYEESSYIIPHAHTSIQQSVSSTCIHTKVLYTLCMYIHTLKINLHTHSCHIHLYTSFFMFYYGVHTNNHTHTYTAGKM